MWAEADVIGLLSVNVGSLSDNVGSSSLLVKTEKSTIEVGVAPIVKAD